MRNTIFIALFAIAACDNNKQIEFTVIDTDFSKGRLTHVQKITLHDLEKLHGHLCDGLVVGAFAMQEAMKQLYPNDTIDRTNLRIVSKPSPCLTDVAIYLSGARYQFNTFYVDTSFDDLYLIQRIDNLKTISISLKQGIKPTTIDSLGNLAIKNQLSECGLDTLRKLEDDFTAFLFHSNPTDLFTITSIDHFDWNPIYKTFTKTDILNKEKQNCNQ